MAVISVYARDSNHNSTTVEGDKYIVNFFGLKYVTVTIIQLREMPGCAAGDNGCLSVRNETKSH